MTKPSVPPAPAPPPPRAANTAGTRTEPCDFDAVVAHEMVTGRTLCDQFSRCPLDV